MFCENTYRALLKKDSRFTLRRSLIGSFKRATSLLDSFYFCAKELKDSYAFLRRSLLDSFDLL